MASRQWLFAIGCTLLVAAGSDGTQSGRLAPFFHPPKEFADDLGAYKSPLKFDDGRPVRSAEDWPKRRREILKYWHGAMGLWPALIDPAANPNGLLAAHQRP